MIGFGYEGKIVNNCRYHLAKQNIFEPKKLRLLQQTCNEDLLQISAIYDTFLRP